MKLFYQALVERLEGYRHIQMRKGIHVFTEDYSVMIQPNENVTFLYSEDGDDTVMAYGTVTPNGEIEITEMHNRREFDAFMDRFGLKAL